MYTSLTFPTSNFPRSPPIFEITFCIKLNRQDHHKVPITMRIDAVPWNALLTQPAPSGIAVPSIPGILTSGEFMSLDNPVQHDSYNYSFCRLLHQIDTFVKVQLLYAAEDDPAIACALDVTTESLPSSALAWSSALLSPWFGVSRYASMLSQLCSLSVSSSPGVLCPWFGHSRNCATIGWTSPMLRLPLCAPGFAQPLGRFRTSAD